MWVCDRDPAERRQRGSDERNAEDEDGGEGESEDDV